MFCNNVISGQQSLLTDTSLLENKGVSQHFWVAGGWVFVPRMNVPFIFIFRREKLLALLVLDPTNL